METTSVVSENDLTVKNFNGVSNDWGCGPLRNYLEAWHMPSTTDNGFVHYFYCSVLVVHVKMFFT